MANPTRYSRLLIRLYRQLTIYVKGVLAHQSSGRDRVISGLKAMGILLGVGFALLFAYTLFLIPFTPSISEIRKASIDQPAILVSADGKRLATLKPMNREWVRLKQVSPQVIAALLATEDHRFIITTA